MRSSRRPRMAPVSYSAARRCAVTPVNSSPASIAQKHGSGPRWRGNSDGCTPTEGARRKIGSGRRVVQNQLTMRSGAAAWTRARVAALSTAGRRCVRPGAMRAPRRRSAGRSAGTRPRYTISCPSPSRQASGERQLRRTRSRARDPPGRSRGPFRGDAGERTVSEGVAHGTGRREASRARSLPIRRASSLQNVAAAESCASGPSTMEVVDHVGGPLTAALVASRSRGSGPSPGSQAELRADPGAPALVEALQVARGAGRLLARVEGRLERRQERLRAPPLAWRTASSVRPRAVWKKQALRAGAARRGRGPCSHRSRNRRRSRRGRAPRGARCRSCAPSPRALRASGSRRWRGPSPGCSRWPPERRTRTSAPLPSGGLERSRG